MHRYRLVAQTSLILSILNLVLAAPIVVQRIYETRGDGMVVAEDAEAASDRPTSPQHSSSSDGSTSSGYPAPYLSSDSSVSGYSWLLDRPPRLSPQLPASLHESAFPHSSCSGSSERLLEWLDWLTLETPPSPHFPALQGLASPHPLGSPAGSSEIPPSLQLTGSDRATTGSYSPQNRFTPSHHPLSLSSYSDESLSTPHSSASDVSVPSHHSIPEGLAPSHPLTSDGSPPSPSSPPTETPPDNAEFLNKNVMKKLKIVVGVTIVGGAIAGIVGSQIKHRDYQDS